jgi:repressor LexA
MDTLGARLREARRAQHLSQVVLAAHLGISQPALAQWERGRSDPSLPHLIALAVRLEVTTDYLVGLCPSPGP